MDWLKWILEKLLVLLAFPWRVDSRFAQLDSRLGQIETEVRTLRGTLDNHSTLLVLILERLHELRPFPISQRQR
jgi:hypothetical protein